MKQENKDQERILPRAKYWGASRVSSCNVSTFLKDSEKLEELKKRNYEDGLTVGEKVFCEVLIAQGFFSSSKRRRDDLVSAYDHFCKKM